MIKVKLFGVAKKSLSADKISIDKNNLTITELLDFLQKNKTREYSKIRCK